MKYIGLTYSGVIGAKSGTLYSIERGKEFEAEVGDIPPQFAAPALENKMVEINGQTVETASVQPKKRGRKAK